MTVVNLGDGLLVGLNSDKKPLPAQVARGNRFIELSSDYSKFTMFICNGLQWIAQTEFREEYQNKTIDYNKNTITNLPISSGGTGVSTGSNVGVTGFGIFKQVTNEVMELNNVDIGSTKLTMVQDSIGNTITFDVAESNLRFSAGVYVSPITVPTTDPSYGIYYVDSADSNKPKFKKPDGTVIDLSGSGAVSLSNANTWTNTQTIASGFPELVVYRAANTVGFGAGINIDLNNSSNAETNYVQLIGGIDTNTAGSEKGFFSIALTHTGSLRTTFKINPDGIIEWGDPTTRYGKFSPSGLTASRVFTFPDADTLLVGVGSANVFTTTQKVSQTGFPSLTLYRQNSTVGFANGIDISLNNSSSAEIVYAEVLGGIDTNTSAGSVEKGFFSVTLRHTGTLRTTFKLNPDGIMEWGDPTTRYGRFSPSGLSAARVFTFPNSDAQLAGSDIVNTFSATNIFSVTQSFTAAPKVTSGFPELTLYRAANTAGFGAGIDISLNNSSSAEIVYAEYIGGIDTNTAGSEKGFATINVRHTGSLRTTFKLNPDGVMEWGDPTTRYGRFSPSGLTAARVFTFPDSDAQLAGSNISNTFTAAQIISANTGQQFTFYRPNNTVGVGVGCYYDLDSSTNVEHTYGIAYVSIEDNIAATLRGDFFVQLAIDNSVATRFRVYTSGNGGIICGKNARIQIDQGSLSGQRVFTLPDSDSLLIGNDGTAVTLTDAKNFSFGTSTGTKFGTATNQRVGFFNATPVIQQTGGSATAGGTYTATEQGMLQKAYDCLRALGFLS